MGDRDGAIRIRPGLGRGTRARVTAPACDAAARLAGGFAADGIAGGWDGKGAVLPELGHLFQPGEDARQAGAYQFDNVTMEPTVSRGRPRRDGQAERRDLRAQRGSAGGHVTFNN